MYVLSVLIDMLRYIAVLLLSMLVIVNCLSVEVAIKGPTSKACRGIITFVALDSDCGNCLYGVKSFRYASVTCKTDADAAKCCTTVSREW
ncbi:hypothetical protein BJ944DRAFT_237533 [Cunninghamella echinulata]|nr:hypothetical protein BJ944DRAFT_237533 [Cunninghamella echinulata]